MKKVITTYSSDKLPNDNLFVGSVVEWLKHCADDQHGFGSKPLCAILFCPWERLKERHFTALSPAWQSWQAISGYL